MKKIKPVFCVLLFFAFPIFLTAQSMVDSVHHIKEVIVSSDRLFKKEEAGMKETKIDSTILTEKISLSLSELLSENSSIFIKSHGRGALATASFRGMASSHTQVNWNGINITSPMLGMVDFSLIPVYIIDDMNLKHGTASIADGSGGLGGSVNISNKVNWDNETEIKYIQTIGSYKTFDEFLEVAVGNKKIQSKTRIYHNYSKNDYTFINRAIANIDPITGGITNPLDTNHNADYTKYGVLQDIYFRPNNKNIFSVKYWGQHADRTIPQATSYEGPDNSNLNNQKDTDHKLVADWKYFAPKYRFHIKSGYSGKQLDYTLKNNVPGLGIVPAIYSESTQNSFLNSVEYSYNSDKNFSINTSIDVNYHNVATRDSVSKTGYQEERFEMSFFLSASKSFKERLNLNFMMRQDFVDKKLAPFVPYFGFDFKILKEHEFIFKGNIARNYHQPSLNDLYWQPGGNPNLLPEDGRSYELGLEYRAKIKNIFIETEVTAYNNNVDNWIIWIPSFKGYWEPRNIKKVLSKGVEYSLHLNGKIGDLNYKAIGTYNYTSSINYGDPLVWGDESYGKQLVYVPLHSGNIMCNLSYKNFFFTYQHNSYSERFTTSSNNVSRRDWLYPYFMNDVSFGKKFKINKIDLSVKLKVFNLFNETYHSILYRPMPKRNYLLLITFKL